MCYKSHRYLLYYYTYFTGSDRQPERKTAGGVLLSFQYVAVILIVSYSANLVSNLTLKEIVVPFDTLEDLAEDSNHVIYMNHGGAQRTLLEVICCQCHKNIIITIIVIELCVFLCS